MRMKKNVPSAVSSDAWRQFYAQKDRQKMEGEDAKLKRKRMRQDKKAEKDKAVPKSKKIGKKNKKRRRKEQKNTEGVQAKKRKNQKEDTTDHGRLRVGACL